MEGEINNLIAAWIIIAACLCYCHTMSKFIPQGKARFVAVLPVVCIFLYVPLKLTMLIPIALTSFMVSWVAIFNLLQLSIGKGPLSSYPPLPLFHFFFIATFPIRINNDAKNNNKTENQLSLRSFAFNILLSGMLLLWSNHRKHAHPILTWLQYFCYLDFAIEISFATFGVLIQILTHVQVKQQFNRPYMATSVQDFWGRRWNLVVSDLLRTTVYNPVRSISSSFIPHRWLSIPAVFAAFTVSGLMHELLFWYMTRGKPDWKATYFFLVQGLVVSIEIFLKKTLKGRYHLPVFVSRPLTLAFVFTTGSWLFFPSFLKSKPFSRFCSEILAVMEFINHQRIVNPNDISCPLFEG